MKEPSSPKSEGKHSPMAFSSSAFYYRQPEPTSITGIHQMSNEADGIMIEIQPLDSGNCFTTDASTLSAIVTEKNPSVLSALGGVTGVAAALKTSLQDGVGGSLNDISHKKETLGSNIFLKKPARSFFHFAWEALQNPVILILLVCAALSLGLGIKQDELKEGWYDGGSIFLAVFVVISASATADFVGNRRLGEVSEARERSPVTVIRGGRTLKISPSDVVVGDVVSLTIGDQVPADGLFVEGYSFQIDESSLTGDSALLEINHDQNPFLRSGAKVANGRAKMLITSVGMNTEWGKLMSLIDRDSYEKTPLEAQLDRLASSLGKVGLVVTFIVLVMLLVRYFTGYTKYEDGRIKFIAGKTKAVDVMKNVVEIIAAVVSVLVVAVPTGLSLVVKFVVPYSMKRLMMTHLAIVRNLSAFEAMSSVTTIFIDIYSILASNHMKVTKSFLGKEWLEGRSHSPISPNVLQLLFQAISLSKTSTIRQFLSVTAVYDAIHSWAVLQLNMEMNMDTSGFSVLDIEASFPEQKIGFLVKNQMDKMIHAHWKGDAEIILSSCSHYQDEIGNIASLDGPEREIFRQIIEDMAARSLQSVAFAHKQISEEECENQEDHGNIPDNGLVLLGIVGLKAVCQPGVKAAVAICRQAGINIKVITDGNALMAKAVCTECGILSPNINDGSIVEGTESRNYTDKERLERAERISVMPKSSPMDKLLMVRCLKEKGHVVGVTGNSPNDAPALKEADIGISVGNNATAMVKESSDIVVFDENFASIAKVLRWGRCVYSNIQKHIQFHLTVYISALVSNVVAAVLVGKTALTSAQLLWVRLIIDILGAQAIAAEEPTMELMKKPPVSRGSGMLITNVMCRNITVQALYQIIVVLVLNFRGKSIFGIHDKTSDTFVFTTFVLFQVFNLINVRKLEEKNVLKGILKNKSISFISGAIIFIQVVLVELLNKFAHTERLDLKQWGFCIGIAAFSLPVGLLTKFLPVPDMETIWSHLLGTRTTEQAS